MRSWLALFHPSQAILKHRELFSEEAQLHYVQVDEQCLLSFSGLYNHLTQGARVILLPANFRVNQKTGVVELPLVSSAPQSCLLK